MSILSSNNAGLQSTIRQWWIDIRSNNSPSWDVSSSGITVVKAGDGYVILDRSYFSTSVKILSEDWNKRSRLLRGIYTYYSGSKKLRSIAIDIISAEQDTEIDFIGMTDKFTIYIWAIQSTRLMMTSTGTSIDEIKAFTAFAKKYGAKMSNSFTGEMTWK